jgi:adenylate kinase
MFTTNIGTSAWSADLDRRKKAKLARIKDRMRKLAEEEERELSRQSEVSK